MANLRSIRKVGFQRRVGRAGGREHSADGRSRKSRRAACCRCKHCGRRRRHRAQSTKKMQGVVHDGSVAGVVERDVSSAPEGRTYKWFEDLGRIY